MTTHRFLAMWPGGLCAICARPESAHEESRPNLQNLPIRREDPNLRSFTQESPSHRVLRVYNNMDHRWQTPVGRSEVFHLTEFNRRFRPGCALWTVQLDGTRPVDWRRVADGYLDEEKRARVEAWLRSGAPGGPIP